MRIGACLRTEGAHSHDDGGLQMIWEAVALTAGRIAILAGARGSPGPPDQVWRLERYRQEYPDVDIQPPGTDSAVWRAFRDGNLIAYGFTLMVFLDRLETLPELLGAAQHFGLHLPARNSPCPAEGVPARDGRVGPAEPEGLRALPACRSGIPGDWVRRVVPPGSAAAPPGLVLRHHAVVPPPGNAEPVSNARIRMAARPMRSACPAIARAARWFLQAWLQGTQSRSSRPTATSRSALAT